MSNQACAACASVLALLAAGAARAQEDVPRFWCEAQQEPVRGTAAADPRFVRIVRVDIGRGFGQSGMTQCSPLTGTETATVVCNQIEARLATGELAAGKIAVMLIRLGEGTPWETCYHNNVHLIYHPDDALPPGTLSADPAARFNTPWTFHGVDETLLWYTAFIDEYQARRLANPNLPPPDRFIYDNEAVLGITYCHNSPPGPDDNCTVGFGEFFAALQNDPRYSTEIISGTLSSTANAATLRDLFEEANLPATDPSTWLFLTAENQQFGHWYSRIASQVLTSTMDITAFQPANGTWGALSGNYTYWNADGATDPALPPFVARNWNIYDPRDTNHTWQSSALNSNAHLQMPVLYGPFGFNPDLGYPLAESALYLARYQLDTILHSGTGVDPAKTMPFIDMYLYWYNDPGHYRDIVALSRAKGVKEYALWASEIGPTNLDRWIRLHDVVDQVYGVRVFDSAVTRGEVISGATESLFRSEYTDPLVVTGSDKDGTAHIEVAFKTNPEFPHGNGIKINIEAWAEGPAPVACFVELFDNVTSTWEYIDAFYAVAPRTIATYERAAPVARFYDADGIIRARLIYASSEVPWQASTDLVQIVGLDPCPADFNRDGVASIQDLFDFLAAYNAGGGCPETDRCPADFNRDRQITVQDLFDFLNVFFAGCGS
ncbi:MAG: GC-type dockerin domain-anchored protein [Phycisphaerales bacterium]